MCRCQILSFHMGLQAFSDANTHASPPGWTISIHSRNVSAVLGGTATALRCGYLGYIHPVIRVADRLVPTAENGGPDQSATAPSAVQRL